MLLLSSHLFDGLANNLWELLRNLTIGALIGDVAQTPRAQHLAKVLQVGGIDSMDQKGRLEQILLLWQSSPMSLKLSFLALPRVWTSSSTKTMSWLAIQVDMEWKINEVSDGSCLRAWSPAIVLSNRPFDVFKQHFTPCTRQILLWPICGRVSANCHSVLS